VFCVKDFDKNFMKRIIVFAVGLALFLLSGSVSNGQVQTSPTLAARRNLSAYESNRNTSEFKTFTGKENKRKRFAVRRKVLKYAGKWRGILYQPDGTLRSKFNFTVRLYQKGRKISGFSRITIIGSPQYYGVMKLRGTAGRNRLSFLETKITRENPEPDSYWCIKSGKLKLVYIKGNLTLKGNWQGANCSPGTIVLRKVSGK
jgi:hypothetical protein